jgi:hypothetical protein
MALVKGQPVPEGVRYREVTRVPGRVLHLRPGIGVVARAQFGAKRVDIRDLDTHGRARRGVAMMLGKVQVTVAPADTHVQRRTVVKAVFEHHLEPQEAEIELACLGFVEAAKDWGGAA